MQLTKVTSKKLLLIDDEATIRDAVRLALEGQDVVGFDIFESSNAEDGLVRSRQILPDIIILDLHMPARSGFDFMDLISKEQSLERCRVIMLTGDDTIDNIVTAEQKHISPFRFVGKPFDVSELQAIVYEAAGLT
jgi:two-component system nitrate/nitrite response regulator NarL